MIIRTQPLKHFSYLHIPLVASLLGGLTALVAGCSNDAPPVGSAVIGRDSLPVMVTYGVSKLISDSGVIKYKMIAEEWRVYDRTQPPRWDFPKGIFIQRYDEKFKVNMHITADTAWIYDQKICKMHGHVVLHDKAAQTHLKTEELIWDMKSGDLASDTYTCLTQPNQEIEGDWFRAKVQDNHLTQYHVKQSKGFMPVGNVNSTPTDTVSITTDTIRVDSLLPSRKGPVSRRKV